ncbi:YcxB family protein [Anaeromicropila populeti]|uniref:YcxB-like protein n=1 Tax=Anaeromicropila populeti TaxID=37658 RepID=A0A1I6J3E3_9FIRM|nr:YcxB family protein [Anaeromicropila populeti]SFR73535.1 YcxB-like protein [Anaeromicropila populeti]
MEKEVRLSIIITPKDMHHFLVKHTYGGVSGIVGILISVVALIFLAIGYQHNDTLKNVMLAGIGALFTVVQPLQLKLKAAQQVKLNPMFQKPLLYLIDGSGIKVSQMEEEAAVAWEDIRKVVETKKSIIVYMSPVRAFIWPKEQYSDKAVQVKELISQNLKKEQCKWSKV